MPHPRHGAGEVFMSALKELAENAGEHLYLPHAMRLTFLIGHTRSKL
jgi:hypothetical protein